MRHFELGIRLHSLALVFAVALTPAAWAQKPQQTSTQSSTQPPSILYDDFNQPLIDPLRWITGGACYSSNFNEMECVRAIQAGKLLLAHRNFGQRDSDTGNQFGSSFLNVINPGSIRSIAANIVVRDIEELPCAANPQFGGAVQINATFFNAGSGNSADDVGAQFALGHSFTDPRGQLFVFAQIFQGFNYFGFVPIGNASIGSPITATLTWDKANHQFIATETDDITHVKNQITLPYSFSDSTPATNPTKQLTVVNFPANCTSHAAWVYTEATFDNVRVGQ
jgi:hypothetical protein